MRHPARPCASPCKALRRNKMRSALTMLGVIIGVASVIAMIALGSGARASIDEQIQSQGTNLIFVSAGSSAAAGARCAAAPARTSTLTLEDAQAIAQQVGTVGPLDARACAGAPR